MTGLGTFSFESFPNLTGGNMLDNFDVADTGSLSGTVDGTAGGDDTIDIADVTGIQTIDLQNTTIAGVINNFTAIESFVGDDANDVLVGPNAAQYVEHHERKRRRCCGRSVVYQRAKLDRWDDE